MRIKCDAVLKLLGYELKPNLTYRFGDTLNLEN